MDWQNLIIQLGISGLVLYVVFKIGMKALENMSKSDSERTQAIKEGFSADTAAHQAMTAAIQGMSSQFSQSLLTMSSQHSRIEGKLDAVLDLTPVREMRRVELDDVSIDKEKIPSVIVDLKEDDDTPVDRPPTVKQPRPPSSVAGMYGPKKGK